MTNKAIAGPLKETAALIELTGGNSFRARALANAARIIERLETPVATLIESGEFTTIKGLGTGLAAQVNEILHYGSFELRDDILGGLPPGLLDVLSVKGLGAKKVRALWQKLSVQSLDDLEGAALSGRIAELEGFGKKSQESILENLTLLRSFQGKRRLANGFADAEIIQQTLEAHPAVSSVSQTGTLARRMEIVENLSFVVSASPDQAENICSLLPFPVTVSSEESRYCAIGELPDGLQVVLLFCEPENCGVNVLRETGPESFVSAFLNDHPTVVGSSEQDLFEQAGARFLAPELRDLPSAWERRDTLSALPLLKPEQLKGVLHNHSTYSDGAHTLREMSLACRNAGYEYFGICDHSQSLRIASGMSVETLMRQKAEIAALNAEFEGDSGSSFRVFFGVESDILGDGSLDYPDEVLAEFDMIVASIHVRFNMTETEATDRIIRAVANPYTTILGHPTGRLILKRAGYPLDHEAVLQACALHGVAIELNASPYRLDLDWRWIERAVELNVPVAINPDAHSIEQLDLMKWGVVAARKGGLTARHCLNALSLSDFKSFLHAKKIASGIV